MNDVPLGTSLLFLVTVLAAFLALRRATRKAVALSTLVLAWIALQSAISLSGFYRVTSAIPPRLFLVPSSHRCSPSSPSASRPRADPFSAPWTSSGVC